MTSRSHSSQHKTKKIAFAVFAIGAPLVALGVSSWNNSRQNPQGTTLIVQNGATPAPKVSPAPTKTPQLFVAPGVKMPGETRPATGNLLAPRITPKPGTSSLPNAAPTSAAPSISGANNGNLAVAPSENAPKTAGNALAKAAFERGSAALNAKDLDGALAAFREAVQLAPNNVPTRLNLALIYGERNDPKSALPHLQKAAQLEPKNAAIQFNLAKTHLALKKPADALPALRRTVQLAPKEPEGRALLGEVLLAMKQPKEAYTHVVYLANADKKDVAAHLTAAAIANDALRKPKDAEKWLRRAVSANPREPQPAILLSQLLVAQKKPKEAEKVLSSAVKARPDVYELYPPLADARLAAGNPKGAADALRSAILRLPAGKTEKEKTAIRLAQAELRVALGRTLGNSKQPKAALIEFERAAQLAPKAPEPLSLAAIASAQLKQSAKAQGFLERALKLDPKRDRDRRLLAQMLAAQKKWKEADAQMATYTKNQPKDLEALLIWSQVAQSMKNAPRELEIARKMTVAAPKDAFGWGQLAVLQKRSGDKTGALQTLATLQKLQPNSPDVAYEIALLETENGDHKTAFNNWRTVLEKRPDYTTGYMPLLESASKSQQLPVARQFLARILAGKPENLNALTQILKFYEQKNQTNEAKAFLTDLTTRDAKQKSAKTILESFDKAAS